MAAGAFPFLKTIPPTTSLKGLAAAELALGTALLTPVVPNRIAGLGLTGFAGSVWPTQAGTGLSKDVWMLGIGLGLLADPSPGHRR